MQFSSILIASAALFTSTFAAPAGSCTEDATTPRPSKQFVTPATSALSDDPHLQFASSGVIKDVTCDSDTVVSLFDQQIAELKICNGIAAPITDCPGTEAVTTGVSRTAMWTLTAPQGATINVFKGSWEQCCNAARATCPGTFTATCIGGVTSGEGFTFSLTSV